MVPKSWIGMTCGDEQAGGGARLAPEALLVVAVVGEPAVQSLDGDRALAGGVERAEHLAHPAAPDALLEPVGPEPLRLHYSTPAGRTRLVAPPRGHVKRHVANVATRC